MFQAAATGACATDHFEVELVMQDQSGKTIRAVGIVFMYEKEKERSSRKGPNWSATR